MDAAAIAGLCAVLAQGGQVSSPPAGVTCPPAAEASAAPLSEPPSAASVEALAAPGARDGIARVAYAEAGNQGDSGRAAVIYTILNRLADGRWGGSVNAVLDAHAQFEPVLRVGGDWRRLPPVSQAQQARVDTILNLALDGRLPDLTHGARYFQNPAIVARRAQTGEVGASLVNFGGATPSAVIGAHSFFVDAGRGGGSITDHDRARRTSSPGTEIFVGENRAPVVQTEGMALAGTGSPRRFDAPSAGDPSQALFVGRDGLPSARNP